MYGGRRCQTKVEERRRALAVLCNIPSRHSNTPPLRVSDVLVLHRNNDCLCREEVLLEGRRVAERTLPRLAKVLNVELLLNLFSFIYFVFHYLVFLKYIFFLYFFISSFWIPQVALEWKQSSGSAPRVRRLSALTLSALAGPR